MFEKKYLYKKIKEGIKKPHINHNVMAPADTDKLMIHFYEEEKVVLHVTSKLLLFDTALFQHSLAVSCLSFAVAKYLNLGREKIHDLSVSGLLHDIGKTQLPKELVKYKGKYNDEQYRMIMNHSLLGHEYIINNFPEIDKKITDNILNHHEKLNGTGYPNQIDIQSITMENQIISVSDFYDAFISKRSYHTSRVPEEGEHALLEEVDKGCFDNNIVNTIIKIIKENCNGIRKH